MIIKNNKIIIIIIIIKISFNRFGGFYFWGFISIRSLIIKVFNRISLLVKFKLIKSLSLIVLNGVNFLVIWHVQVLFNNHVV